ncbi:Hemolysin III [Heterostelium album PN500]|uniref:Hemolysin III n=1 Tax=Heterostelium pallidum (strain ATCC 26659 / Pp 5 / PN500) TaxID=670386 RepID=D3BPS8_HETP5|nr:Hemolysin III [Heterostelium album PN500]EFA76211.1 Hemolysin III [Heterostelium album PN500]|eukprot:XP_020428344.1 Hemolysin III [Heterostelium album PN500]
MTSQINDTMVLPEEIDPEIQSFSEEIMNTLSHTIGLFLCIPAVFFLISVARMRGTRWHVISCSIYGISLMTMYFCSSLYHSVGVFIHLEKYRLFFKDLDHCAIYLLIAGLKLLVSGGLAYTSGVGFLVWETTPFNHAIWHLFVGAGSILHYFCILECIIPSRKDGPPSVIIDNIEFAEKQISMAFFGSRGRRQKFIVKYMHTLYRVLIGWAFKTTKVQ